MLEIDCQTVLRRRVLLQRVGTTPSFAVYVRKTRFRCSVKSSSLTIAGSEVMWEKKEGV